MGNRHSNPNAAASGTGGIADSQPHVSTRSAVSVLGRYGCRGAGPACTGRLGIPAGAVALCEQVLLVCHPPGATASNRQFSGVTSFPTYDTRRVVQPWARRNATRPSSIRRFAISPSCSFIEHVPSPGGSRRAVPAFDPCTKPAIRRIAFKLGQ